MFDRTNYFKKLMLGSQGSEEEKTVANLLYNDLDVQMNDSRLNNIAALTYNSQSCTRIFNMIEKSINPTENPWKIIYKALLILNTIILYGSELSIDKSIDLCKYVYPLQDYNSALIKKGFFNSGGGGYGTDYGAPVRAMARTIVTIIAKDENIRKARQDARQGQNSLVPMGNDLLALEDNEQHNPAKGISGMTFGQIVNTSVGAGFGLENVPGMYEGRPERYFDNTNDPRNRNTAVGNHQITRDVSLSPSPSPFLPCPSLFSFLSLCRSKLPVYWIWFLMLQQLQQIIFLQLIISLP